MRPFAELRDDLYDRSPESRQRVDDEFAALRAEARGWADWCRIPNVPGGPQCGQEATHEVWWVNCGWEPACDKHAATVTDHSRVRPLASR